MECYAHKSVPAVGVCKSCGKAICRGCVKDLTFAVVCSDACAIAATRNEELEERARRMHGIGTTKRLVPMLPLMFLLFTLMFCGLVIYGWYISGLIDWVFLIFAAVCALLGMFSIRQLKEVERHR